MAGNHHNHSHQGEFYDNYCERIAGGYGHDFGEPLNVITNLAFIIASWYGFLMLRDRKQFSLKYLDLIILAIVIGVIGLGSAAYHALPSRTTLLMDVLPIALYIHLYIFSFCWRILKLNPIFAILGVIGFIGFGILFMQFFEGDELNGTINYMPTYIALVFFALLMKLKQNKEYARHLMIAVGFWTLSLSARSLDMASCEYTFGIGVHIFWHIFNAIVLYKVLWVLSDGSKPKDSDQENSEERSEERGVK